MAYDYVEDDDVVCGLRLLLFLARVVDHADRNAVLRSFVLTSFVPFVLTSETVNLSYCLE